MQRHANILRRSMHVFVFAMFPMVVNAQSVDDILADANAQSEKIQNVLRELQNGDQVMQFSLVEALLEDSSRALRRIGREHALFSTNPVLQNMAVESVFSENAQVRMVLMNPNKPEALKWLEAYGGGQDGQTGFVMMPVGDYDTASSCWADPVFKGCRFTVLGNSVQFRMFANGGQAVNRASAALTLQPDGWLRGAFTSGYGSAQLSIDLKE